MRKHIKNDLLSIISDYQDNLISMSSIASRHGVSRQYIYQILKSAGINTSKRKIPVHCSHCGTPTPKHKSSLRITQNSFCSVPCFRAYQDSHRHPASKLVKELIKTYYPER